MSARRDDPLVRAVDISRQLLDAAQRGDGVAVARLDAERLQLLKSARSVHCGFGATGIDPGWRETLREVARLNDQAIGHLEHHRRIAGRRIDVVAVGRRAVNAYASTR